MKMRETLLSRLIAMILPAMSLARMYIGEDDEGGGDDDTPNRNNDLTFAEDGAVVGTGNATRLAMMDRINDQNERALADDLVDVVDIDKGETAPFVPNETPPDAPAAPQGNEASGAGQTPPADDGATDSEGGTVDQAAAPAQAPAAPAPQVAKIKVNGQEVELTPELVAKAQKIASADTYMEEATTALRRAAAAPSAPTPPAPPSAEDVAAARLEEERALVRAIQVGTEDEALTALRKIRAGSAGPSPDDIAAITDERINFNDAINWFNTEYKDLVGDKRLHKIVLETDATLVEQGDKRSYRERYKAIGDDVRAWRDSLKPAATPAPPPPVPAPPASGPAPSMQAKIDRKAAAPSIPTPASARAGRAAGQDDDAEESPSDIIAKMAKSRGGPQWARN